MMPQKRGTTTNLTKLAGWDIDYYLSLSDEECLVCLTKKELYLLRNPLKQMEWSTRWQSQIGTPRPDIENIAERLAFKLSGEDCIDFCMEVENCIETSEGVQNALLNFVNLDNFESVQQVAGEVKENDISNGDNPSCSPDVWFGGILELVVRMNRLNVDCLEIFEANTNELDFLADVVGDITGIDESSLDALLAWINQLQENIAENYNAQYTTAYEDEISCALFCLAIDACELTPDMIFQYFSGRIGATLTWESLFINVINYLIGGEWAGTQIADFMMLSQIMYRKFFGFFFEGNFFKDLSLALRVGFRSPSTAWVELCDDCPVLWEWSSDFPVDQNIWIPRASTGLNESVWVDTQGFNSVDIHPTGAYWRVDAIQADFDPTTINNIQLTFNLTKGTYENTSLTGLAILAYSGGSLGTLVASNSIAFSATTSGDGQTISLDVDDTVDYLVLFVRSSLRTINSYSGACKIVSATITGEGDNPFD